MIDDYAHNPAKCAASIKACQPLAEESGNLVSTGMVMESTRFLRQDFVEEISNVREMMKFG